MFSEQNRYKLQDKFEITDLIKIMFEDFDKWKIILIIRWRYYQIILLQIESNELDFSRMIIKVLVQSIK
jgi:hypothetical protein